MITDKTKNKIAKVSAKRITDRLSYQAYEQVVENLCLKRCGRTPDGELCDEAERALWLVVALLFKSYSGLN